MGNCNGYMKLSEIDRGIYDTELLHACRTDAFSFKAGKRLIKRAKKLNLFDNTIIRPTGEDLKLSPEEKTNLEEFDTVKKRIDGEITS